MALKKRTTRADARRLEEHLGYEKHAAEGQKGGNSPNGRTQKTVVTDTGAVEPQIPRDLDGTLLPQVVVKGPRRLEGFDDKVTSPYARGLAVREIQGHIQEMHDTDVSPDQPTPRGGSAGHGGSKAPTPWSSTEVTTSPRTPRATPQASERHGGRPATARRRLGGAGRIDGSPQVLVAWDSVDRSAATDGHAALSGIASRGEPPTVRCSRS